MKYAVHCDFWEFILSLENIEFLCEDFLKAKKNIFEKDSVSINTDYTEIIISETKQILEIIYKYYNDDGSFKY
ncbi:MAG: hypothetical protein IJK66_04715 [Bacilli bacterium]|nr:hypothetical protein [Bacilli bacterium]